MLPLGDLARPSNGHALRYVAVFANISRADDYRAEVVDKKAAADVRVGVDFNADNDRMHTGG